MTTDKAQQLTTKINAAIEQLSNETDTAKQSEQYRAWLTAMSRFHRYSFGNQILISLQRPDATRVAGFHAWKDLGRSVKKGEKGITILAPIIRKYDEEKNGETTQTSRVVAFRCATAFAIEQTEGKELPELDCNATTGGEALLPALEKAAASLGIQLAYASLPGSIEGLSRGGAIEIEETLNIHARCGVIAHELAHELLNHKERHAETTKQQRELEAESVAFAVLAHFGARLESRFYLATYNVTGEMLTASLATINATARQLIDAINTANVATEQSTATEPTEVL